MCVTDTRICKSENTLNLSLRRTEKKRKAFYLCMYVFLCSPNRTEVSIWKKKLKHIRLLLFVEWKNPWSSRKDVPSKHCAKKVLLSSVHTLSVHHSRLLNAELLRFDLRDPNIDIFTVPLTM